MLRKYPSIFLLVFIIFGIVLSDITRLPSWIFLLLSLFLGLSGLISIHKLKTFGVSILFGLSLLSFAGFHYSSEVYDVGANHIINYINKKDTYHIYGQVCDWPDLKLDQTEVKVSIDSVINRQNKYPVTGKILLKISDTTTVLQRGDKVEFYGHIYPVKGGVFTTSFDYKRYFNQKGIFGIVYLSTLLDLRIDKRNRYGFFSFVDKFRDNIRKVLYQDLSPPSAALAAGFLIGETRDIPTSVYRHFRDSGTLHLLAVSGSNVALVLLFFMIALRPFAFSRKKRYLIFWAVILVFDFLSYGQPSVMRASVMAALIILAKYLQRKYDLNNIIALAAVIILLFDPAQLYDVGFQLSFLIAWSLIYVMPPLAEYFKSYHNYWWYRWLIFPFLVSLVAQISAIGLIALYFHQIPVVSPLANLIIVPLVSLAVIGTLFLLSAHLILPLLGALVGSWLNLVLKLILYLVNVMGGDKMPLLKVPELSLVVVILFYFYLYLFVWSWRKKIIRRFIVISLLVIINVSLVYGLWNNYKKINSTEIYMFSIPGGVVAVIPQAENNSADVVVTGMARKKYTIEGKIISPQLEKLDVKNINSLFLLSSDYHALADVLNIIKKYQMKEIYINQQLVTSFKDAIYDYQMKLPEFKIYTYGNNQKDIKQTGYYLSNIGLLANFADIQILFCDKLPPVSFEYPHGNKKQVLVLGRSWQISKKMLRKFYNLGYKQVICSNIAQSAVAFQSMFNDSLTINEKDFLCDLSHYNLLRLNIKKLSVNQ